MLNLFKTPVSEHFALGIGVIAKKKQNCDQLK
jgi:hypothetical protein